MSLVRARGATYAWPGRRVGPVDLDLGAGVWRLDAPNGAGKTTLLRMLCGDLRPTAGEIRILGADPFAEPAARRHVSWLPAAAELPEFLSVDEAWRTQADLRAAPTWDGTALRDALGLSGATRLGALSAGQRKKAELVAALAGEPEVLLLDEPFAPLDREAVAVVAGWIEAWRADRAVLLVAHGELPVTPDATLRP